MAAASTQARRPLCVVPVPGDGDCLFHALALLDTRGGDGADLRAELIDFMDEFAVEQEPDAAVAWTEEAEYLRGGKDEYWGGDIALIAYSLMRRRRVLVHTKDLGAAGVRVEDRSHDSIAAGATAVHVLYNGHDHYDGLVEVAEADAPNFEPAWPQPSPPEYLQPSTEARPPWKPAKRARAGSRNSGRRPERPSRPEPQPPSRRRYREKTTPAPGDKDDLLEEMSTIPVARASTHPRRQLEDAIRALAERRLREDPTIPPGRSAADADAGHAWPRTFCAFVGCKWEATDGTEDVDLLRHLEEAHSADLQEAVALLPNPHRTPGAALSVYSEAVARVCRGQAPVAGSSLDRTALGAFAEATSQDRVEALVCFCCARIFPLVDDVAEQSAVRWRRPLSVGPERGQPQFFNRSLDAAAELLGLDRFLEKYDRPHTPDGPKLTDSESFEEWQLKVPRPAGAVALLCCPEDHRCAADPGHVAAHTLCTECEVPVCRDCYLSLRAGDLPPVSLANDMWTGFAPERLYTENVTILEMICASPCVTTLILLSMDARYRQEATAMDERVHMARHRYGARGNALTFPLPWEDLLQTLQGQAEAESGGGAQGLPRSGRELGEVVRVLLKTNKTGQTSEAEIKGLIHQANVRRRVVVDLIMDMKRLGHPSFADVSRRAVGRRAAALPIDGVPPEVLMVIEGVDDSREKLQPQKAATPSDGRQATEGGAAGAAFAAERARAVVPEGRSEEASDQAMLTALHELKTRAAASTLEVRTGNRLVDQFQPLYFATAYCFCFKYGTACPDVTDRVTAREGMPRRKARNGQFPSVDIHTWAASMQRRVESQFRRDWNFGFTVWNYLFRTMVNVQRNTYAYAVPAADGHGLRWLDNAEIAAGIDEILHGLRQGSYEDVGGRPKPVKGDLSKLRYVPGLSEAARKALSNLEARTKNIPGTHEVRTTMRHQTHANRVCYGASLFVTMSPSERDTTLMLRLARARRADPALLHDGTRAFQGRSKPDLDIEYCCLGAERLADELPSYEERRALLARDPLACAEGFRTLMLLTMKHVFGVRCCPRCPDCATSARPCTDAFGSNATAAGGVFGRVDAVYGSIETQKLGTLHGHFQVFVECDHQHTPLRDMQRLGKHGLLQLLQKYTACTAHVRRMVYSDPDAWNDERRAALEEEWPEYRDSTLMVSRPRYQRDADVPAAEWKDAFLARDVEALQQHKQHHVNLPHGPDGQRMPLAHCRDPKDPTKCKAGFPRDRQLTETTRLICPGLAEQMDMPAKGKRSMLGALHGPVGDPNLNGTHPALLAAERCNSDVQLPYRFPITEDTHDAACGEDTCARSVGRAQWRELAREAQRNQAAQAGYAADYANKRLAIAVSEVKEWQKGQRALAEELQDKPPGYVGARVVKRLITDCHARGVNRGAVECTNLTIHAEDGGQEPTRAETIKTAQVAGMALHYGLTLLEAVWRREPWPAEKCRLQPDTRPRAPNNRLVGHLFWTMYGGRGRDPRVRALCAYEFVRHYHFRLARHPYSEETLAAQEAGDESYEARLTVSGAKKLRERRRPALVPGIDYLIRENGGDDWAPLGQGEHAAPNRHDWVMAARPRPYVPILYGAQGSRTENEQAMRLLLLFCPWTNDPDDATARVLRRGRVADWRHALRARLLRHGFPTEEVKRFAQDFCFVYCLPRELRPCQDLEENSDNEDLPDEPLVLTEQDMPVATATHVRGSPKEDGAEDDAEGGTCAATDKTEQHERTREMFQMSASIWRREGGVQGAGVGVPDACAEQGPWHITADDHETMKQAARASRSRPADDPPPQGHAADGHGRVGPRRSVTAGAVMDWLRSTREHLNTEQQECLGHVVARVLVELDLATALDPETQERLLAEYGEPLVWLLPGPPGTGKSHVLGYVRKLFEEVLGYARSIDYEVAAFQAVNAAAIGGKTLHGAAGVDLAYDRREPAASRGAARRMAYWRWLLIDEISMVGARLLTQVEQRLRKVVPDASGWKLDEHGSARPFAGLNVLFMGDFGQLPPPSGGFLGDVPRRYKQVASSSHRKQPQASEGDPLVEYGKEVFWESTRGVTELTRRERCKDDWWNEVVDELRRGLLSDKNYRYLHGLPVEGCALSAEERASRRRVITGCDDPRLQEPKFKTAPVIVANNDARYQINKDRAAAHSREARQALRWSQAHDRPSNRALQEEFCSKEQKIRWLQYHDRDTGDLCGMLPLALGMQVALTDHLDRSPEKLLLRGRVGTVFSWLWHANDQRPEVVYVKFDGATWRLPGAPEPGVYPIRLVKRAWFLDGKRPRPVLRITRTQLPLTPAYAMTAHASQGQTLPAELLDLNVDKRTDVTYGTVAISRVRRREDLLILRPFEPWHYQRGAPEGPELLLRKLRGEQIDWQGWREGLRPCAACRKCGRVRELDAFAAAEWDKIRANRGGMCLACVKGGNDEDRRKLPGDAEKHRCHPCDMLKIAAAFPRAQLRQEDPAAPKHCLQCCRAKTELRCSNCGASKPVAAFHPTMVTIPDSPACTDCQSRPGTDALRWGWFKCRKCDVVFRRTAARGEEARQQRHCANCAIERQRHWRTCMKKNCQKRWQEEQSPSGKRLRYCPQCRRP